MNLFDPKTAQVAIRSEVDRVLGKAVKLKIDPSVVEWASFEVERQHEKAGYVKNMIDAWMYAKIVSVEGRGVDGGTNKITVLDIITLGYLVKPDMNSQGVRRFNVSVGWNQKLSWYQVPRALENLVDAYLFLDPVEYYREFEEIHPFGDGNGRVGSILYNWKRGTLEKPEYPPDVYDPEFWYKKGEGV